MAGHRLAVAIAVLEALGPWSALRHVAADPSEPAAEAAPARDPRAAKKWAATGQQLMQKGNSLASRNRPGDARPQFEGAASAYRKAIEASDDINLYVELAGAEERLGKLDDAVKHLRQLTRAQTGARPDALRKASVRLDELLARVGLVTLIVVPSGTSITLGGIELGMSPLAEPLVLMPGTYTLAFQADGFLPREAELKVEPGSESERTIELEPVKVIVEPVAPPVVEHVVRAVPPRPSRLPLYTGAAIAVAAVAGAGVLGALAIHQHAVFTHRTSSFDDRENARVNGKRLAQLADAAVVAAVVAAGFTAYWYFYRYRPRLANSSADRSSNPSDSWRRRHFPPIATKLGVVPWVQPDLGGVAIAGGF